MAMVLLTISAAALVFLRAWQQQNVIHGYYWWAGATSYAIAVADVTVLLTVVDRGMQSIAFLGTGGAIGVVSAMFLHRAIRK